MIRRNDSAITGVGGSLTLLKGEHPAVQMVRERVALVLEPSSYAVTVDFVFRNVGPATTVAMGFPESGSGDVRQREKSQMLAFGTWIDGVKTAARWVPVKSADEEEYRAHWVKSVTFGKGQTRGIRVTYRSEYGGAASGGLSHFVRYRFTGGNWKGKVEESALSVTFRRPGTFVAAGRIDPAEGGGGAVAFEQKGATLSRTWRDWEAQADFTMAFGTVPAGWRASVDPATGEEAALVPGVVLLPSGKTRTVYVAGSAPKSFDWCPPAFDLGGETMIAVRDLDELTGGKWEISPENPKTGVTLTHLGHAFEFALGKKIAKIDGNPVTLGVAPQTRRTTAGGFDVLYVPLKPFAKALGLTIEAPPGKHSVRLIPSRA